MGFVHPEALRVLGTRVLDCREVFGIFGNLWPVSGFGGGIRTSFILLPCTKLWYLPRFRLFVQHTAQGCGTRHAVTSVHANCDDAQNTGIYHVFASLYDMPHNNAEQDTLSQASMPIATMPKTLVCSAFSPRCTLYCARMWEKKTCRKRPCLWLNLAPKPPPPIQ